MTHAIFEAFVWNGVSPGDTHPDWFATLAQTSLVTEVRAENKFPALSIVNDLRRTGLTDPGDWIVRTPTGGIFSCPPAIFEQLYAPTETAGQFTDRLAG